LITQAAGDRLSSVGALFKNPLKNPAGLAYEINDRLQRKFSPAPIAGVHPSLKVIFHSILSLNLAILD